MVIQHNFHGLYLSQGKEKLLLKVVYVLLLLYVVSGPPYLHRVYYMAISEIWACFTFSLNNNGDILMLIEIIFD